MQNNKGLQKEEEFKNSINDKYYDDLNNNLKRIIRESFKTIDLTKRLECGGCLKGRKADVYIKQKEETKYYSLKSGTSRTVHEESLYTLIPFLKENNISVETLKTILYFQFGDGTINGTGSKRLSYSELFPKLEKRIKEANVELNQNKEFIKKCFERFILDGWGIEMQKCDFIYHGNTEYGVLCSRKQLLSYLEHKNFSRLENLHIGPLLLFPRGRFINFDEKNPEDRYKVIITWPNMQADLSYINERFNF